MTLHGDDPTRGRRDAPRRVVVADDDRDVLDVVVAVLDADPRFAVVGEAADGLEVLDLVREHVPDLVVLDLAMPHLDGIEVARALRGAHPRLGILMCSGDGRRRREAMLAGVDGWVDKPADRGSLISAMLDVAGDGAGAVGLGAPLRRGSEAREQRTERSAEAAE